MLLPVLDLESAKALEAHILENDSNKTWDVMQQVGYLLGKNILEDFCTWHSHKRNPQILILCGKGHNAADALLAAHEILKARPRGSIVIVWACQKSLDRPLLNKAYTLIAQSGRLKTEIELHTSNSNALKKALGYTPEKRFDITLDGLFGLNFTPPLNPTIATFIEEINASETCGLKVAVDIPSGLCQDQDSISFKADFTYQTGIPKTVCIHRKKAAYLGRVRVLDLGFFEEKKLHNFPIYPIYGYVPTPTQLELLATLRPADQHKYKQGCLAIIAGSPRFPGALLLCVQAALRSGVGVIYAFAPKEFIPSFSAQCPEVIWRPMPQSDRGIIEIEDLLHQLSTIKQLSALVVGPGIGSNVSTEDLASALAETLSCPIVFDADALQPSLKASLVIRKLKGQTSILTPHPGELHRLSGLEEAVLTDQMLMEFAKSHGSVLCFKGYIPRVTDGEILYHLLAGGPILSRGGSGDILAGLIGGLMAETPNQTPIERALLGSYWHALSADVWARHKGERATHISELLRYLPEVLRSYTQASLA